MAYGEDITDLEAVDYALGGCIAGAFTNLADNGPEAWRRFVKRPTKQKIYYTKNDDVQSLLHAIARHDDEKAKGKATVDLPIVVYYRDTGFTADMNQHVQVWDVKRFINEEVVGGMDAAMKVTTIPITLTYSLLFLAWDKPTIERMAVAWWAWMAPLYRKNTRFMVKYNLAGDMVEVGASVSGPREIATSSEPVGEDGGMRLWGSRTMCEVLTQAIYGCQVQETDVMRVKTETRLPYGVPADA